MNKYKVFQIDAFTTEVFKGNPAGVVLNADGLNVSQMQAIARELNNSETAFLFEPDGDDHDVLIRYFTPTMEIPVCGHATIASHFVRALEYGFTDKKVKQKCGVGVLDIEVKNSIVFMTQKPPTFREVKEESVLAALGVSVQQRTNELPVEVVNTGNPKIMVALKEKTVLDSLSPDMNAINAVSSELDCPGVFAFTLDTDDTEIFAHGRMFAPALGIPEDPVTGNANGPLGAYLTKHNIVKPNNDGWCQFTARQGEAMGRPGEVEIFVKGDTVKIAGEAVKCFETTISI